MAGDRLADILDLVADRAPKLRQAGVTGRVDVAGIVSFDIAAAAPPTLGGKDDDGAELDVLDDPDTFGGSVPRTRSTSPASKPARDDDA